MSPVFEAFLSGVIATATLAAALFFLKFWRITRDRFFLAFAASFFIEGINRVAVVFSAKPNERASWTYVVRLISFLLILAAIAAKNHRSKK